MSARTRKFCLFALVMVILGVILLKPKLFLMSLNFETRAILMRFQGTVRNELFLFIVSCFNWLILSPFLDTNADMSVATRKDYSKDRFIEYCLNIWKQKSLQAKVWRIVLLILMLSCHASYTSFLLFIAKNPYKLAVMFFLCLGLNIQLFIGIVLIKFLNLIFSSIFCKNGSRIIVKDRMKSLFAIIYAVFITSVGFYNSTLPPAIQEVTVPVQGLASNLNHMTITLVADVHLGPTVGRYKMEKIVNIINYLKSDMVVIAGDLVDAPVARLSDVVEPLAWIKATYGTYFATGNHEYYTGDVHEWLRKLDSLGLHNLHNTGQKLPPDAQSGICLAGVNDPTADEFKYADHSEDFEAALGSCEQDSPVILVAHQPATAKRALDSRHRVDLVLSGHTHGGQMFPFIIGAYLMNPFFAGLYEYGENSHVYVSMGTQYWGIPVRFGTSCEITKITLVGQ